MTDRSPAEATVAADRGAALSVRDLTVGYGKQAILESINLTVPAGVTLVVLGESGCGKTTLLRALAGAVPATSGSVTLDGVEVLAMSAARRGIVYLDQEPLLFEHLTVAENLGFAPRLRGESSERIRHEVAEMLRSLDLAAHGDKREWQLSGGQKQRVAFGRAVLARPRLLLLDEPFGSLDAKTRQNMQTLFAQVTSERRLTALFVTHDVKEALLVGSAFARMENGSLHHYESRESFRRDPATGIPSEVAFWRQQDLP